MHTHYYNYSTTGRKAYQQFITNSPLSNPLSYFFLLSQSSYRTSNSPPSNPIPYLPAKPSQSQTIPYQLNPAGNVLIQQIDGPHPTYQRAPPPPPFLNPQSLKKTERSYQSALLSIVPEKIKRVRKKELLGIYNNQTPHRRSSNRYLIVRARLRSGKVMDMMREPYIDELNWV